MSGCSCSSCGADVLDLLLAEPGHAQDVEHQHAVVRGDRAPALRHDRRVLHAGIVAHASARGRRRRRRTPRACSSRSTRSWSASRRSRRPGRRRCRGTRAPRRPSRARRRSRAASLTAALTMRMLGIWLPRWKCRSLKQSCMPRACSSSSPFSTSDHREAELRAVAARRLPLAAAARGQLDAHPDGRADADLLRVLENRARARCISRRPGAPCGPPSGPASPSR